MASNAAERGPLGGTKDQVGNSVIGRVEWKSFYIHSQLAVTGNGDDERLGGMGHIEVQFGMGQEIGFPISSIAEPHRIWRQVQIAGEDLPEQTTSCHEAQPIALKVKAGGASKLILIRDMRRVAPGGAVPLPGPRATGAPHPQANAQLRSPIGSRPPHVQS